MIRSTLAATDIAAVGMTAGAWVGIAVLFATLLVAALLLALGENGTPTHMATVRPCGHRWPRLSADSWHKGDHSCGQYGAHPECICWCNATTTKEASTS